MPLLRYVSWYIFKILYDHIAYEASGEFLTLRMILKEK